MSDRRGGSPGRPRPDAGRKPGSAPSSDPVEQALSSYGLRLDAAAELPRVFCARPEEIERYAAPRLGALKPSEVPDRKALLFHAEHCERCRRKLKELALPNSSSPPETSTSLETDESSRLEQDRDSVSSRRKRPLEQAAFPPRLLEEYEYRAGIAAYDGDGPRTPWNDEGLLCILLALLSLDEGTLCGAFARALGPHDANGRRRRFRYSGVPLPAVLLRLAVEYPSPPHLSPDAVLRAFFGAIDRLTVTPSTADHDAGWQVLEATRLLATESVRQALAPAFAERFQSSLRRAATDWKGALLTVCIRECSAGDAGSAADPSEEVEALLDVLRRRGAAAVSALLALRALLEERPELVAPERLLAEPLSAFPKAHLLAPLVRLDPEPVRDWIVRQHEEPSVEELLSRILCEAGQHDAGGWTAFLHFRLERNLDRFWIAHQIHEELTCLARGRKLVVSSSESRPAPACGRVPEQAARFAVPSFVPSPVATV